MNVSAATLATLMANLLDNALRFTPRGGRVDVGVASDAGRAVLSVIDNGPGIPVAARQRVFERFYREAGPDDASRETGSGLGLSIVRRIADSGICFSSSGEAAAEGRGAPLSPLMSRAMILPLGPLP